MVKNQTKKKPVPVAKFKTKASGIGVPRKHRKGVPRNKILREVALRTQCCQVSNNNGYGYEKPVKGRKINCMKAGILESGRVLTVSPYYAEKLVSGVEKDVELDNSIRRTCISGIINDMDIQEWNPSTNKYIDGPAKNWELMLLSLGAVKSEPGIEGEEIAPFFKQNVATP